MHLALRWTVGVALLLAACGGREPPAVTPDDIGPDGGDDAAQEVVDDAVADDTLDDADAAVEVAADVAADVTADAGDVVLDVAQCAIDDDCSGKVSLSVCQLPKCAAGVCVPVKNPDVCCIDTDCDDGVECNTHKCDQVQHKCVNAPIANCCSGKVLLQDAGFEAGMDNFTATQGADNGNVSWQQTSYRAHGGQKSLYFGNACHTYDNSMTLSGACKPLITDTKPVAATLLSKPYLLPKDKTAQAHFWLWLDTEPSYAASIPLGVCDPPCNVASTCIQVAGAAVCEPEKDVLTLQVLAQDAPAAPVFWSTQIGKTTLGDPKRPDGWRHIAIDLSAWQGKTVQLAWQFATKTNTKNGYEGIYLDDVTVETICPNVADILCTSGQACADDGLVCTADTCTSYSNADGPGVCFHDNIAACCLGDADCNDGNACTADACVQNACKSVPDATKPGCCTPATLFSDAFDVQPLSNWVNLGLNSVDVLWRPNPTGGNPAGAGNGSLYFGNDAFSNYDDPSLLAGEGPHGATCAKPIQLDAGTNFKLLQFDLNLDTEWSDVPTAQYMNPPIPGAAKLDWFSVQILTGGVFETAWSSDAIAGTTHGKWQPITVSLDAWAGKSIQICLRFDAGDAVLNDKPGVNVDNLSLAQACQKAACYWDSDCPKTACGACQQAVCSNATCGCAPVSGCP